MTVASSPARTMPVLFGRARASGGFLTEFLAAPESVSELTQLPSRRLNIGLQSADGATAFASLEFGAAEGGKARYRRLVEAFLANGERPQTVIDPRLEDAALQGARLGLWSSQVGGVPQRLDREAVARSLVVSPSGGRHALRISSPGPGRSLLLQTAASNGPALLIVVPPGATGVTLRTERDASDAGRPLVLADFSGLSRRALTYGRFLAAGATEAAHAVGMRLAHRLFEEGGKNALPDPSDIIAAVQWCVRSEGGVTRALAARHLLREVGYLPDARILEVILLFHYPSIGKVDIGAFLAELEESIVRAPPAFTETISLLADNIRPMHAGLERDGSAGPRQAAGVAWFRALARATVWACPFTTFHGLEPRRPTPTVAHEVLADAKKKPERLL